MLLFMVLLVFLVVLKDIVEDCGINRNSFYYHYADLPALLEEVVAEDLTLSLFY